MDLKRKSLDVAAPPLSKRNPTRAVRIGSVTIGHGHPIVVQSMCATKTSDVETTARQLLDRANAAGGLDNTTVIVIDALASQD